MPADAPFVLETLQAKADAMYASRQHLSPTAYGVVTIEPITGGTDTIAHFEMFDVDAANPDPANGLYPDDASARSAALARMSALQANPAPFVYAAAYSPHDDPPRLVETYAPPKPFVPKVIEKVRENKGPIAAVAAGLVAVGAGVVAMRRKKRK